MKLKKELGLIHVFCIASGAMISSGLFILPGLAHAKAGPAVVLSYLFAGLLSLPGMLSLAEMTTAMPRAGGDCFTIIRSMGPGPGTVAGLLSWFSLSMKSAFALIGMSIFTTLLIDIDVHIIAVSFCLVFLIINIIGIKEASRTQVILVMGLLLLILLYIIWGLPAVDINKFEPFAPYGWAAIFSGAGFVFVSYGGLLKVASVAEEIKKPGRNIPLGMILSLLVVSIFYFLMVFVTTGVLNPSVLGKSLTPISDGAGVFMGSGGIIALSIAAILAFLSTANAGIMTAARSLIPLSRDNLFPKTFGRINLRFQTPHNALLLTGFFIIASLFLKLEILVEAASVVLILTNILTCVSVIILRESRIQNYQPIFKTPFYPWMQIIGIIGLCFLLFEMGIEALMITLVLIVSGFFAYWFYGRIRGKREYALLHLIERVTAKKLTTHSLEKELREILHERDEIIKDRFDHIIEESIIIDIEESISLEQLAKLLAETLSSRLNLDYSNLLRLLIVRGRKNKSILSPNMALLHIVSEEKHKFDIILVRSKKGIVFSEFASQIHGVFVVIGPKNERNFHLFAVSAIIQIIQEANFEKKWLQAKNIEGLRDIILLGKRERNYEEIGKDINL